VEKSTVWAWNRARRRPAGKGGKKKITNLVEFYSQGSRNRGSPSLAPSATSIINTVIATERRYGPHR
jgi:hypothetical protein